jgi:hypothetical protein
MMEKAEIYIKKEIKLKNPVLIEGLPGLGWVGKLSAEHLIKEIGASKFGEIYSPDFPPQVTINPDSTVRMMKNELYAYKAEKKGQRDLIVLVGDHQGMTLQSHYSLVGTVLDTAEEYGVKTIYTLGGYGVGRLSKEPKVFGAVTHKDMIKEFKKHGVVFDRVGGSIVGAAGLFLGLGMLRDIRGICLMGETHGNYIDPRAARSVLEVVCKALNLKIRFEDLEKRAKETEEMISRLEQVQGAQQQPMPQIEGAKDEGPLSYIR